MVATTEKPLEERRRSLQMIDKLVGSRTEMLMLFTELAGMKPFTGANAADAAPLLQEFCQSLVDYTANAHFQLYRYFAENNERRKGVYDTAESIYPAVLESTNKILDFNDKYDCGDHCSQLSGLENDLSHLGEVLAERIEAEDKLISAFGYNFDG